MEKITSKNNILVKDTKKLFTSSKARYESRLFALEGARLCFDVLNSVYEPDVLLFTEDIYVRYRDEIDALSKKVNSSFLINEAVSQKLSETKSPQGVFLTVKMKDDSAMFTSGKIIALDNVQDPANVGAIIRSAEALGIDGVITYNCCDVFNSKALRASMGSILRMNIVDSDNLEQTAVDLKSRGFKIYSTVPSLDAVKITDVDFSVNAVSIIGNEANGVEENIKAVSDGLITIPMLGRAESLNAGVAAAITMWEMLR